MYGRKRVRLAAHQRVAIANTSVPATSMLAGLPVRPSKSWRDSTNASLGAESRNSTASCEKMMSAFVKQNTSRLRAAACAASASRSSDMIGLAGPRRPVIALDVPRSTASVGTPSAWCGSRSNWTLTISTSPSAQSDATPAAWRRALSPAAANVCVPISRRGRPDGARALFTGMAGIACQAELSPRRSRAGWAAPAVEA